MKTKFWGKSMEIMPVGQVHLQVADSHYVWNKVTTCVHNLFSNNQRWADQYGEMKIEDINHKITCKLTFAKVSSLPRWHRPMSCHQLARPQF